MQAKAIKSRRVQVSNTSRILLDACDSNALLRAQARAAAERDRAAHRVAQIPAYKTRARSRKIESAVAHAVDAAFFGLLAERLAARRYGRKLLLAKMKGDVPEPRVCDLDEKSILECAEKAAQRVAAQNPWLKSASA